MELTEAIARFAIESSPLVDSPEVVAPAKRAILDTLGVALAGSVEPVAAKVADFALAEGTSGQGQLWGRQESVSPSLAALVNATAAHALDYDDISHSMKGRPSAAVLPAVLAMAERTGATGADTLAAYVVAVEIECKLGVLSADASYERGWQTSCTLAVIGAAAAGCRLLKLNVPQTVHAIGLAVAQASGSRRQFGSMGKPFQVGRASQSAVIAAELAARGLTGGARAIEGEAGYFDLYAGPGDAPIQFDGLPASLGNPFDLVSPGFNVKLYPCGGAAHPAIEALLSVAGGVRADDVERIVVDVKYTAPIVAHQHRPRTGLEGKFSLQYILAAALIDGRVGFAQFTDDAVNRPEAQALLGRVECRVPADMQKGAKPWPPAVESRVELQLRSGEVRNGVVVVRRGQGTLTPLAEGERESKFLDCATRAIDLASAERVIALVEALEQLDSVQTLTQALARA